MGVASGFLTAAAGQQFGLDWVWPFVAVVYCKLIGVYSVHCAELYSVQ